MKKRERDRGWEKKSLVFGRRNTDTVAPRSNGSVFNRIMVITARNFLVLFTFGFFISYNRILAIIDQIC